MNSQNSLNYSIYSGSGNDFVMINNLDNIIPFNKQKEFIKKICNEQFMQIDGVIFLERPIDKNSLIRMNYYNRDGSYGAMCGNGARCISRFALDKGILNVSGGSLRSFNLEAVNKVYRVEILDNDLIKIYFPPPNSYKLNIRIEDSNFFKNLIVNYVDLGSEHLVIFINDEPNKSAFSKRTLDKAKINEWGSLLRYHKQFQPNGANVNFVDVLSGNELRVRTYERGVERETLACGTGVISSVIVSAIQKKVNPPVKVLSQSGEWLEVDFDLKEGDIIEDLSLKGSAKKISEGKIKISDY